jgi:hypothetical protein
MRPSGSVKCSLLRVYAIWKAVSVIRHGNVFRSYWIPGSYALALSEKHKSFLKLLKNKGFKEESMTKFGVDAIGMSTTLESNKSLL